jgi:O-methyltransferase involved in polyketide biosynthesis
VELDALADGGPTSMSSVASELDAQQGLAVITEGLLGYLPHQAVREIWARFARALSGFASGRYISDIHIGELQTVQVRAFRVLLSLFVRGRVHLHFGEPSEVKAALREAGFARAEVWPAASVARADGGGGARLAHVLEALA